MYINTVFISVTYFELLARVVLILVITFVMCWTPFHMRNIFKVLNVHLLAPTCKFIEDLANIGAAANSVVNPFIYSFLSTQFRQKLGQILERKMKRRRGILACLACCYTV